MPEIEKPGLTKCQNQCAAGCAIYEARPKTCSEYICLWRAGLLEEDERPEKVKVIYAVEPNRLFAQIAAGRGVALDSPLVVVGREVESGAFGSTANRNILARFVERNTPTVLINENGVCVYGRATPFGFVLSNEQLERLMGYPSDAPTDPGRE